MSALTLLCLGICYIFCYFDLLENRARKFEKQCSNSRK